MTSKEERRKQHRHRHKQRVLRGIPDELVNDFDTAAHTAGSDRSRITKQLWEWYVKLPGAKLPQRPDNPPDATD